MLLDLQNSQNNGPYPIVSVLGYSVGPLRWALLEVQPEKQPMPRDKQLRDSKRELGAIASINSHTSAVAEVVCRPITPGSCIYTQMFHQGDEGLVVD